MPGNWESRHPLFIYPAPDSTDVNDGYLIDRIKLTPSALQELIDVPGYNNEEIMAVLKEIGRQKNREWLSVDQDRADIHDEESPLFYDSSKVDCIEFWGAIQGDKLIDWGMSRDADGSPLNDTLFYNVIVCQIG